MMVLVCVLVLMVVLLVKVLPVCDVRGGVC